MRLPSTILLTAGCLPLLVSMARGHMHLVSPPPLNSKDNPNTPSGSVDYSYDSPLAKDGADFPCKGYLKVLGTPAGASVATWAAGSEQKFSKSPSLAIT